MSSLSSVWSRSTLSTMTTRTTVSDASTSAPHTPPSSSSVVTGLKASLGTGPFFHAHLQEGQRIEDDSPTAVSYEVSTYAIGPNGVVASGKFPQKSRKASVSVSEEMPRVSQRHAGEVDGFGAQRTSSSTSPTSVGLQQQASLSRIAAKKWTRSASATGMPSDPAAFWREIQDAQAAINGGTSVPRRYHYITRSQSASAAADASHPQQAPKMRKQNASYTPGIGTAAYHESVENTPIAPNGPLTWCPTRGRYLSPIEEVQFFPEKQGDTASLHSTHSAQSNLFIHRSVRRTGSTSTLNSGHSISRLPDDPTAPHNSSPSRSYGPSRPVFALPVIPASPRESQNVFDQDPVLLEEASKAHPMPVIFPPQEEYPEYQQQQEQDLGETLSTPRFAIPRYLGDRITFEEQDLADGFPPRDSFPHSQTPSLISRSESIRTELTYLTAQDSASNSRRGSATPGELELGRRRRLRLTDPDTTLVDTPPKPSPVARLKASIDTLLSKSPKMRKSPGGINNSPTVEESSTLSIAPKLARFFAEMKPLSEQMKEEVKSGAPWSQTEGKQPAKVLFWTGFFAPWCWLIGGWMLARSGETMAEGLPSGAKEPVLPLHNPNPSRLQIQVLQQTSGEMQNLPTTEKQGSSEQHSSILQAAKASSIELLDQLRGHMRRADQTGNANNANKSVSESTVRAVVMHGDVPIPILIATRVDPWVSRCRVAAVVSGMFILALCIVALVVLVRAL